MAVRTIGVNITGADDVKKLQKMVTELQKTVIQTEKSMSNLGGSGKLPSFDIKVNVDTTSVQSARQILSMFGGVVDTVKEKIKSLVTNMVKLSTVNPAKAFVSGFKSVTSEVLTLNSKLESMVRNTIVGKLQSALNTVLNQLRNIGSAVVEETKEIGDSLVTYRLQMAQMGKSDTTINTELKTLTDYGKNTVYDASDLITQAGNYTAYGRDDAIDLVKAISGLSAQTANPNESIAHIGTQLNDVLARQKVTWQDVRIMKTWFNAQGSKAVQDILQHKAIDRGYNSVTEAISANAFTVDDLVGAIKEVGLSDSYQKLVNTIATPTQALDNLKENLSNLFIVPDYGEDGSLEAEAPLQKLYDSVTSFIKGISDIVSGSTNLKNGIRAVASDLSGFIDSLTRLSNTLKSIYAVRLVDSFKTLRNEFKQGKSEADVFSKNTLKIVDAFIKFNNQVGSKLGSDLPALANSIGDVIASLVNVGGTFISSGFINSISELFEFYKNLGDLSVNTGAVQALSELYGQSFELINEIITQTTSVNSATEVVSKIKEFSEELLALLKQVGVDAGVVDIAISTIGSVVDGFTNFVKSVKSSVSTATWTQLGTNIQSAVTSLVNALSKVYSTLVSSAIKALASGAGKRLMDAIVNFMTQVNNAIISIISMIGGGSVTRGMENIIKFITTIINGVSAIVSLISKHPLAATSIAVAYLSLTKLIPFFTKLGSLLELVANMNGMTTSFGALSGLIGTSGTVGASGVASGLTQASIGTVLTTALKSSLFNLLPMTAVVGSNLINNQIQNSNASSTEKSISSWANALTTGGGIGASIGSFIAPGIGTVIGGGLGAIAGGVTKYVSDRVNKETEEAEKEAKKEAEKYLEESYKEETEAIIESVKSLGEKSYELRQAFSKSILGNSDDGESQLNDAISYVQSLAQNSNTSVAQQLKQLGVNAKAVPENIEDMYVNLNGTITSWTDLKSSTGLNDEELLGALMLADEAVGQHITSLTDASGNVVASIQTLTASAQQRNAQQVADFQEALKKHNAVVGGLDTIDITHIDQLTSNLEDALSGSYYSVEDQKEALATALANGDQQLYEDYMTFTVEQLKQKAQEVVDSAKQTTGTPEELKSYWLEQYEEVSGLTGKALKDKVKELSGKTVEEIQQAVTEATQQENFKNLSKQASGKKVFIEGVANAASIIQGYLDQLNQTTHGAIQAQLQSYSDELNNVIIPVIQANGYTSIEDVPELAEILDNIGIHSKALQDAIVAKINGGASSLQEAITLVQQDYSETLEERKATLSTNVQELFNQVAQKLADGSITLDQAKQLLSNVDITSVDTSATGEAGANLKQAVIDTKDNTTNKVNAIKSEVDKSDVNSVDTSGVANARSGLMGALQNLSDKVGKWISNLFSDWWNQDNPNYKAYKSMTQYTGGVVKAYRRAGGIIPEYHADGGFLGIDWKKRGTDTVPTMLTPGEYVLRKKAVDSLGTQFLNKLNSQGVQALQGTGSTTNVYNVYNNNNAQITQNVDNKAQYLNGMNNLDRLMRYV